MYVALSHISRGDSDLLVGVLEEAGDRVDDDVGSDHDPVHVHVRDLVFDDVLHVDMLNATQVSIFAKDRFQLYY